MPTCLSPRVYGEGNEPGGAIEGVPTSIAAFIGLTQIGPFDTPRLVTSWSQFSAIFGDITEHSYLPRAVYGYFDNGGSACYVIRVGADTVGGDQPPDGSGFPTTRTFGLCGDGQRQYGSWEP